MKKYLLLGLAMVVFAQSNVLGFATIVQAIKGGDEISFKSNVKNVSVFLNDRKIGIMDNAFSYKVERNGKDKVFVFKKSGYKSEKVRLGTKPDSMFWGNILFGGSFGSSTDSWFTNNSREHTPKQFFIELKKG
jgi:hypothetical protein